MKKNLKVSKILWSIGIASLFLTSCLFVSCNSKKEKKAELATLIFSNSSGSAYTPLYNISVADGLTEKYGLKPKIELIDDSMGPLQTGKIDGRINNLTKPLIAGGNGADIYIFVGTMGGGHIVYANKKIADKVRDPKNWKGYKVGLAIQVTSQLVLNSFLKEAYGYTNDDIDFKYLDSDPAPIGACSRGEVDITSVYYSQRESAESQGLVEIAELVDYTPDYACCRQAANGKSFRKNRQLYVAWSKGLIEAWKIYNNDENRTIEIIQEITHQDEEWVRNHIYDAKGTAHITFNPDPYYNGVLKQYRISVDQGYINKEHPRPLEEYFDISVYADALKEVIAEHPGDQFYKDMWAYFVAHNDKYPGFAEKYPETL